MANVIRTQFRVLSISKVEHQPTGTTVTDTAVSPGNAKEILESDSDYSLADIVRVGREVLADLGPHRHPLASFHRYAAA